MGGEWRSEVVVACCWLVQLDGSVSTWRVGVLPIDEGGFCRVKKGTEQAREYVEGEEGGMPGSSVDWSIDVRYQSGSAIMPRKGVIGHARCGLSQRKESQASAE